MGAAANYVWVLAFSLLLDAQCCLRPPHAESNWLTQSSIASDEPTELSAAERTLVDLVSAYRQAQKEFLADFAVITDEDESIAFWREQHPMESFLPKLLEFEQQHRGSDLGVAALIQVDGICGAGGFLDQSNNRIRPEVIRRMAFYSDHPMFPLLLKGLAWGTANGAIEQPIRNLIQKVQPGTPNYWWTQYYLAEYLVTYREMRAKVKAIQPYPEVETKRIIATLPSEKQLELNANEGEQILEMLSALPSSEFRMPQVVTAEPSNVVIKLRQDAAKFDVSVAQLAKGLLFRERHLKKGSPAPRLKVNLLDGIPWAMDAHAGKVIVVLFGIHGCGPCERVEPILERLHKAHPDALEILHVMNDSEQDVTIESAAAGALVGSVTWDGDPGEMATTWGVTSYPTIHIFDKEGHCIGDFDPNQLESIIQEQIAK